MDLILVVDKDGVIKMANHGQFGYLAADLPGKNVFSLVATRSHRLRRAIKLAFEDGIAESTELTIQDNDGAEHPVMNHVSPLRNDGKTEAVVMVISDLTERKELEALATAGKIGIQHASRMATLGQMAGSIAHEVNNPLAIILGYSDQLTALLDSESLDPAVLRDVAGKIGTTTLRIAKIVRALRAFARDGSGDPLQTVPLSEIFDTTLGLCSERFKQRQIAVALMGDLEGTEIFCRPSEVSQSLLNLLNNASDALEGCPDKQVSIAVKKDDGRIEISISNNGPPIPEEIRDRIFLPFFTTKALGEGTGLGLSISQGLLETQGAKLELDAAHAGGARFVMTFPVPKPAKGDDEEAAA